VEAPVAEGFASFAFADLPGAAAALSAVARAGVAEEAYVLDPATTGDTTLTAGGALRTGLALLRAAGGPREALGMLVDALRGGQRPVPAGAWSLHLVAAGRHRDAVTTDLAHARCLAGRYGGRTVAATIPRVARAELFTSLDTVLGAGGQRWAALNAKVAHSEAPALMQGFAALLERHGSALARNGITVTRLASALSQQAFSFETVFHWRDAWLPLHRVTLSAERRAALAEPPDNPAARALVAQLREETMALFAAQGAASNQLGRSYPFLGLLEPATTGLLHDLKARLDPAGLMNPGVLGFSQPPVCPPADDPASCDR
ncbi:MAG: FAD-binding oxidoreductase, partial [Gammaproteobacteria bacterium]|nr:FAD-binding oxidoreductase [Gammaproteobacteria bacterium]